MREGRYFCPYCRVSNVDVFQLPHHANCPSFGRGGPLFNNMARPYRMKGIDEKAWERFRKKVAAMVGKES